MKYKKKIKNLKKLFTNHARIYVLSKSKTPPNLPDQIGHRENLRIVLVGFSLLRIEGIDVRLHEHVGQHQVLEAHRTSQIPGFVIVFEGLEEVSVRVLELTLAQVHLATAFCREKFF